MLGIDFVTNAPLRRQLDHDTGWQFSTFEKLMNTLFLRATAIRAGFPGEV